MQISCKFKWFMHIFGIYSAYFARQGIGWPHHMLGAWSMQGMQLILEFITQHWQGELTKKFYKITTIFSRYDIEYASEFSRDCYPNPWFLSESWNHLSLIFFLLLTNIFKLLYSFEYVLGCFYFQKWPGTQNTENRCLNSWYAYMHSACSRLSIGSEQRWCSHYNLFEK